MFCRLNWHSKPAHGSWFPLQWLPGVLCTVIGILVVMLYFLVPEKIKEAFSVGVDSYEDEDISYGEGYLNTVFLDGVTVSTLTSKDMAVSWWHWEGNASWQSLTELIAACKWISHAFTSSSSASFIVFLGICCKTWLLYTFIVAKYIFSSILGYLKTWPLQY